MSRAAKTLRVASVNVNGIRAAYRKDMATWLAGRDVDILCLQEVRAPDKIVRELLNEDDWNILHAEAAAKGRAGVLVATRKNPNANGELLKNQPVATRSTIGDDYFADAGRWVEADYTLPTGETLTVVSAYVHSGEVGTPRQDDKYRFLDRMLVRLPELAQHSDHVLIVGDLNVGHTELDIK
ncbi:MAG: endonuclease/exonuclease/phosphatase family protein, partial [Rothia dentocariosa]